MTTAWQQHTMDDLLYGGTPPHQRHSATSKAAALSLAQSRRNTLRMIVLRFVSTAVAGATDDEMQLALQMNGNTQRPRRCELVEAGLIQDSGTRRKTRNGRFATVWVAK